MIVRTQSAGDVIDARCTRCRVLTNHTIVALAGGRVVRVKCNTCGSEHNYHAPKDEASAAHRHAPAQQTRKASSGGAKKPPAPRFLEQWETMMAGRDSTMAPAYDMAGTYTKDGLVGHPVFGVGVVTMVAGNKMEVLFRDGPRLLRCGK